MGNEPFCRAFEDELKKIAVTQAWVREKLHPKGKGKFMFLRQDVKDGIPTRLFGQHVLEELAPHVRKAKETKKMPEGGFAAMGKRIGESVGEAWQKQPFVGSHMIASGRTRVTTGSKFGAKPREIFHHEMFHRNSPLAPRSETLAHTYGALKARMPLTDKIKHVLKSAKLGLGRDASNIKSRFIDPVTHALR